MDTGQMPSHTANPIARRVIQWTVAFTLGFASCGVVTLHTSWGEAIWPGPIVGGLVTVLLATIPIRRHAAATTAATGLGRWSRAADSIARFLLVAMLIAGALLALGFLVFGLTLHD